MRNFKEAISVMEDLCEHRYFDKSEIRVLEDYFGRNIDFAYPGWIAFVDKNGKHEYCGSFGNKATDLMISLAESRVSKVREFADRVDSCKTDEEIMEVCAKFMMNYARSWNSREANMSDTIRRKKILTSIEKINVVQGRHNYERCQPYSAIDVGGHGVVVIRKRDNGEYSISCRAPLCGESIGNYDSMHIQKELIDFMLFIS